MQEEMAKQDAMLDDISARLDGLGEAGLAIGDELDASSATITRVQGKMEANTAASKANIAAARARGRGW